MVGGSYVALECAGFLRGLGHNVAVMIRSIPLRGFDQDMAERVLRGLEGTGVRVLRPAVPEEVTRDPDTGRKRVPYRSDGGAPGTEVCRECA